MIVKVIVDNRLLKDPAELCQLVLDPAELPRAGDYIHVEKDEQSSFGRVVRHVIWKYKEKTSYDFGKATRLVEVEIIVD